jgi:hypothetical protein
MSRLAARAARWARVLEPGDVSAGSGGETVTRRTSIALVAAAMMLAAETGFAQTARAPVATTPHFAFYSDFATNLHDALITAANARRRKVPELFQQGVEKACFDALPAAERAAWTGGVDYYAAIVAPSGYQGREQIFTRLSLAGIARLSDFSNDADRRFVEITANMRAAATPAYERCRWSTQDAANRQWIADLGVLLERHEQALGERFSRVFATPWAALPFAVDVVETFIEAGGNAQNLNPPGLHVLVSRTAPTAQGPGALETIFHEAAHFLMGGGNAVPTALRAAIKELGRPAFRDIEHIVQFYLVGEEMRRSFAQAGIAYETHIEGFYRRGVYSAQLQAALEQSWGPVVDGRGTVQEAATTFIRALHAMPK